VRQQLFSQYFAQIVPVLALRERGGQHGRIDELSCSEPMGLRGFDQPITTTEVSIQRGHRDARFSGEVIDTNRRLSTLVDGRNRQFQDPLANGARRGHGPTVRRLLHAQAGDRAGDDQMLGLRGVVLARGAFRVLATTVTRQPRRAQAEQHRHPRPSHVTLGFLHRHKTTIENWRYRATNRVSRDDQPRRMLFSLITRVPTSINETFWRRERRRARISNLARCTPAQRCGPCPNDK
jgi:hypothetical protein